VAAPAFASLPASAPAGTAAGEPSRPVARQRLLEQDPRLEKPVTLRLRRSPLSAVVAELARQTEVAMRSSTDVADEPALLFVTNQPAKEVMHQLATHFGYRWTRLPSPSGGGAGGRGGGATYELYQDLRSKQDEEALRSGRYARALAALQVALREQMRLAQRPSEMLLREAEALDARRAGPGARSQEPGAVSSYRLREMADPCRRALLQVASLLTADQWRALASGETVHFSSLAEPCAVPLPPVLAQALRAARPSALPAGVQPGFVTAEDEADYRREEQRSQAAWSAAQGFCVSARLSLASGEAHSEAVLSITPAAVMGADGPEEPVLVPSVIVCGQGPATPEAHEPSETPPGVGVPTSWKDDPVLSGKCRLRPKPVAAEDGESAASLNELLAAIAESAGINLVADAYRSERGDFSSLPPGEVRPLYEALQQYVAPYAGWRREGEFFRVRRHRWYHLRPREIPDRLAQQWATALRGIERLTLEGAAKLALSLRDEQLPQCEAVMREAGVEIHLEFNEEGPVAGRKRAVLRAYGSLLPAQRRLLGAGGSVSAAAMTPQARRWLQAALTSGRHRTTTGSQHAGLPADALSLAVLLRSPEGVPAEVLFRYHTGSGEAEQFRIALPRVTTVD
jgi:hypothetical protein